ncbi:ATP-dependent DNA helicase DinG [Bacillus songklensis]|uniref:3'-5' exonuclease DinG n=1 Tax=Bacillus songklensis TaxID=1069116 RepID=A0ABV8B4Z2_9BACI
MNRRFVVVDLETTGHSPKQGDKIIQVAAVVVEKGKIVERFASFVNPKTHIPSFIEQLTNINDEMVKDSPLFEHIAPDVLKLLDDAYFVAHNVAFDLSFLQAELHECGYDTLYNSTIDTVELARILLPAAEGYKLSQLAETLHIKHENPHQADSDAEVTAYVLLSLLEKLHSLPLVTLKQLYAFSLHLKSEISELIEEIMETKQELLKENEQLFHLVHGVALKKKQPIEEELPQPPRSFEEFNETKEEVFSRVLPHYENRPAQWNMMSMVHEALSTHQHALIEAGTGTGKTLGYLIPSVFYAKQSEKPVVVSTHTVSLQQQIMDRDIPILRQLMPFSFKVAILKGRHHYLNLRKFINWIKERETNYDAILTKAKILVWLTETETGDIDEINLPSGGKLFWERINDGHPSPLDFRYPWVKLSFYQRARKRSNEADIVVTNHRLLFMDLMSDQDLLPDYDNVILDEAHRIEAIAGEQFGIQVDYFQTHSLFSRIGTLDCDGLLADIKEILEQARLSGKPDVWQFHLIIKELKTELDDMFRLIHAFVSKRINDGEGGRVSFRYDEKVAYDAGWIGIRELASRVQFLFCDYLREFDQLKASIEQSGVQWTRKEQGVFSDFYEACEEVGQIKLKLQHLLLEEKEEEVAWFEIEPKGAANATFLYSQPIDVSEQLADCFFAQKRSAVLTSATLTVNGSFDYMIRELGLYDFQPLQLTVPSPFDYNKQAKVLIPKDMPSINSISLEEYSMILAQRIIDIASVTEGRMLVLFTSNEMLKETYHYVKELNQLDEYVLFGQGISSRNRTRLLKDFIQFEKSILFGTSSFWEGIDIPGQHLSCLVMVRLPFSPPNEPITAAKTAKLKQDGLNPFMEYSLPQAIIRFKQGFGRLIRTKKDQGVMFVFDNRISTTQYGKYFLRSLPSMDVREQPFDQLLKELEDWWTNSGNMER